MRTVTGYSDPDSDTWQPGRENVNHQSNAGSSRKLAEDSSNITGSNMWVLSKRAIRHFVTTFMCMAREMAILHASTCISINTMSYLEYSKYTTDEVMAYGLKLAPDISDEIRVCFAKINSIREAGHGSEQNVAKEDAEPAATSVVANRTEMPTAEKNWDFLLQKLGPHKLEPRPRKMNAEFTTLLSDVIYIYTCIYIDEYIYIYKYIYERERDIFICVRKYMYIDRYVLCKYAYTYKLSIY